jgi:hypothetical protein
MTHLEEIEKIIEDGKKSNEPAFITSLKVTNVYERVTNHLVEIVGGEICLTMLAPDRLSGVGNCVRSWLYARR